MKIGVVKEVKNRENRVSVTPEGVKRLVAAGHDVVIESGAGEGSGFSDNEYRSAGAEIVSTEEAWSVDLVVKVKEPQESEYQYLDRQIIFTYFHLAGAKSGLTEILLKRGITALAYETLEDDQGRLPLLQPMSAIAGNMAVLMGAYYLAKTYDGKGVQLGTVLGKPYGKVLIIGDGVVGQHAAHVACSMGAQVYVFGRNGHKARHLKEGLPDINLVTSNRDNIQNHIVDADLVVGAVLLPGAKVPHVVTEEMVKRMQPGSVIVDVSIDQGGCVETSRPTTHSEPVFIEYSILHYCVTNMPGAYPRTSTIALTEKTLPYLLSLANNGLEYYIADDGMKKAINIYQGKVTCKAVADALGFNQEYAELTG